MEPFSPLEHTFHKVKVLYFVIFLARGTEQGASAVQSFNLRLMSLAQHIIN